MAILVTGAAGFIGFHTSLKLLERGETVIGIDNLNDYYDPKLKDLRLAQLSARSGFKFQKVDISDAGSVSAVVKGVAIDRIVHLAAQAGVRYSIENPMAYIASNLDGQAVMLELARRLDVGHMVYASSSSVYGANTKVPFTESDCTDNPVSLYGATKKSGELLAESYARLYKIPLTGLRFFTVYGPYGRPDMAYWMFAERILRGEPIKVFNNGDMSRDFTYIDDIVDGVLAALDYVPASAQPSHRVYNLGNDSPEQLMTLVRIIEAKLGLRAQKEFLGMQKGDVERTWADISRARTELGFAAKTSLDEGIGQFISWFTSYLDSR